MIRRDILLADGVPRWLLVSQIEHARISHLLANHCRAHFATAVADESALAPIRQELLDAILRHDDGWAAWEARPGIDPEAERPLSFRELPLDEALANWEGSIASAAEVGPLAAWTVSGHFAALLEHSEEEHDKAAAKRWLNATAQERAAWLAEWQALNPPHHTLPLAAEALLWLQTFDLFSLWLCAVCPAGGETIVDWPASYCIAPRTSAEVLVSPDSTADWSQFVTVHLNPWRLDVPELRITAAAHIVPQRRYRDAAALLSAYQPHQLRWQLVLCHS